jgi:hypothetical protein
MKQNEFFNSQTKRFWSNVRLISESVGYTIRKQNTIKTPTFEDIIQCYKDKDLKTSNFTRDGKNPTEFGTELLEYFDYRATVLNDDVQHNLMDAKEAEKAYSKLLREINPPSELLPQNKQKGEMKKPAYFTSIVNMLIYKEIGSEFDHDPRNLTLVTKNDEPVRTLARRVDGAYPASKNPIAIWEIKEYYYTTTFGSRVADGVYESLLDGLELEDLFDDEKIKVLHYLMVDARYTWWECGKSYLCRLIDMLNMKYVDEIFFGKELIEDFPSVIKSWKKK